MENSLGFKDKHSLVFVKFNKKKREYIITFKNV